MWRIPTMDSVIVVLAMVLVFAGPAQAAGKHPLLKQRWVLYESDHFSYMSNAKESTATAMLQDLELFRKVVLTITGLGEVQEPIGTRAIVFAKAGQFNRVTSRNDIVGYMRSSFRGNRMVTSGSSFGMGQRSIIFHEYIHHLVRIASDRNYPTWYDEGLAETLATIYVDEGRVIVGATNEVRISLLVSPVLHVDLARIVNEDNLNRFHPYDASYFYSMSWALVNFIQTSHMAGLPNRLEQLQTYLALLNNNGDRKGSFKQAFGMSPLAMEKKVYKYLERRRRPILSLPAEKFSYVGKISKRVMTDAEVALELAGQAMFTMQKEAHKIVDSVLVGQPDDPYLLSAKGVVYQIEEKFAEGEALVGRAHAMRPTDVILAIDYADLLVSWSRHECAKILTSVCKQRLLSAEQVYVAALEANPENPELHSVYGHLLQENFVQYQNALPHLTYALKFQPWNSVLYLRIGLAHKGLGERDAAVKHLKKALYWAENRGTRQRASDALVELGVMTAEEASAR